MKHFRKHENSAIEKEKKNEASRVYYYSLLRFSTCILLRKTSYP